MSADSSAFSSSGLNDIEHKRTVQWLLEQGVPEEWAVMIADRAVRPYRDGTYEDPTEYLLCAFRWDLTAEDHDYWRSVYLAICAELDIDSELP